jgi:DNA relaxase NicK
MPQGHVEYSFPEEILSLSLKAASFDSQKFAVNNNPNLSFSMHIMLNSNLDATAVIQGSHDNSVWFNIKGTETDIEGDDNILWTLSELQSLMYLRVSVLINAGSALFKIKARGT